MLHVTLRLLQVQRDRSPLHMHPIDEVTNGKKGRGTVPTAKPRERGVGHTARTHTEVRRPPKVSSAPQQVLHRVLTLRAAAACGIAAHCIAQCRAEVAAPRHFAANLPKRE